MHLKRWMGDDEHVCVPVWPENDSFLTCVSVQNLGCLRRCLPLLTGPYMECITCTRTSACTYVSTYVVYEQYTIEMYTVHQDLQYVLYAYSSNDGNGTNFARR
jgi:hypothetical protein